MSPRLVTRDDAGDLGGRVVDPAADLPATGLQRPRGGRRRASPPYHWCTSVACPSEAVYRVATFAAGAPESHQYFDALGREVQSSVRNFADTGFINVRTQYDERGQVVFESEPFDPGAGETGLLGTRYLGYDALGRLTAREQDQANGTVLATSYSYQGLTTSIDVNNASLLMHRIYNGLDQLVETQDAMGGYTRYAYDGAGNPIVMVDPNGHAIKASFNALGHKLWVDDPNMGLKSFSYNGVGEVLSEHDANNNTVHTVYDALGRMIERRVGSTVVGAWHYDNPAADKGLGLLDYEDSGPGLNGRGLEKHYYYSSAASGRKDLERVVHRFSVNASSTDYEVRYYTDGYYARPKGLRYPGGVGVAYHYNTAGYLVQEKDASSSYVIRQISARDSRNEVIAATLANGALTQSAAFYPATGQMQSIAVTGPGGSLHDLYYEYDGYGNLNYQTTTIGAATSTEGFFYDALHRLTQSSRSYPSGSKTVNYAYDPSGNLTLKDDYATSYTYSTTTRPNAVASITKVGGGSVNFSYDANGNLTSGDGKSLTYTAFNKPQTITAGGLTATFHYGADLARYRQEKTNGETTLYIDKLMEIVSVGASTDYRHYLGENAILTKIDSLSDPYPSVKFVLRDRLGSVVTLTDETGANPERRGYDPFGKPRDGDWAEKTPPTIGSGTTDRGFTDHEHLDDSKLIHMNGRAYDYQLGRFLSVDPYIQEPGNSQSLNPYSYIMNNPLSGVDPSGYRSVTLTGTRLKVDEDKIKAAGNQILGGVGQPISFNGTIAVSNGASNGVQKGATPASTGSPQTTELQGQLSSSSGMRGGTQAGNGELRPIEGNPLLGALKTAWDAATWGTMEFSTVELLRWDVKDMADMQAFAESGGTIVQVAMAGLALKKAAAKGAIQGAKKAFLRQGDEATVPEGTTRVRHYTNRRGSRGIEEDGVIRAGDQNRVFAEPARGRPLSPRDAEERYGIGRGRGRDIVETDVPTSQVDRVRNPVTGVDELQIRGDVPLNNSTITRRP